jgi:hypothetical protein
MGYSFADYENAVLTALAGLKAPAGYLQTLAGQAGQFQVNADGFVITTLQGFPAIIVEVVEANYQPNSITFYTQQVTINLYVVARSWRSQDDARSGDTGVYQILEDIRAALLGNTLGLNIRAVGLEPFKEERLLADQSMVIYLSSYRLINDKIQGG